MLHGAGRNWLPREPGFGVPGATPHVNCLRIIIIIIIIGKTHQDRRKVERRELQTTPRHQRVPRPHCRAGGRRRVRRAPAQPAPLEDVKKVSTRQVAPQLRHSAQRPTRRPGDCPAPTRPSDLGTEPRNGTDVRIWSPFRRSSSGQRFSSGLLGPMSDRSREAEGSPPYHLPWP
jgi:hypothetical protein